MKRIGILILSIVLSACNYCISQTYVEPIVGYQVDLNNGNRFKRINTGVQFSFKTGHDHELILQLQRGWGVAHLSSDSSFSANPSLPLYQGAKKTIQPSSWSFAVGQRLEMFSAGKTGVVSMLIFTGFDYQKFSVEYDYNKKDYTVLNPDKTIDRFGIYISGGFEYLQELPVGRIFIQLTAATPPWVKKIKYPSSFRLMAPLSFNLGYSFKI